MVCYVFFDQPSAVPSSLIRIISRGDSELQHPSLHMRNTKAGHRRRYSLDLFPRRLTRLEFSISSTSTTRLTQVENPCSIEAQSYDYKEVTSYVLKDRAGARNIRFVDILYVFGQSSCTMLTRCQGLLLLN